MEEKKVGCSCSNYSEMVVMSCSGASDLGELTDRVARHLRNNNIRNMKCLTMVAIEDKPLINSLQSANILVIDGCVVDCGKKILQNADFHDFHHIRLTDLGLIKGQTPANEENINKVYNNIKHIC